MVSNVWILKSSLLKNIQTYVIFCKACDGNWRCKWDLYFIFHPNYRLVTVTNRLQTASCDWQSTLTCSLDFLGPSRQTLKWPEATAISLTALLIHWYQPIHTASLHVPFVTDIDLLSFFLAAHYYFVPLGIFSEKFEMWVIMFRGKVLTVLQIISHILLKSLHKTVVKSLKCTNNKLNLSP